MRLMPITADDEDLTVRLECDPEMMLPIGGPRTEADVRAAHKRRLDRIQKGEARMYKIVADDSDEVLGTIGIWKIEWKGPQTYEMGWFVLPEHRERVWSRKRRVSLSRRLAPIPRCATSMHIPPSPTLPPTRSLERSGWRTGANSTTKVSLGYCAATIGVSI